MLISYREYCESDTDYFYRKINHKLLIDYLIHNEKIPFDPTKQQSNIIHEGMFYEIYFSGKKDFSTINIYIDDNQKYTAVLDDIVVTDCFDAHTARFIAIILYAKENTKVNFTRLYNKEYL